MFQNIAAGCLLVAVTVLIHTGGQILIAAVTPRLARRLGFHNHVVGRTLVMTGTVLGLLGILTLEVWTWALAYSLLSVSDRFGDALYLSTAMFSTLGYGEISVNPVWRLMTALEGINGFLVIGWSTAYLVGAATRHGPSAKASISDMKSADEPLVRIYKQNPNDQGIGRYA
jgi:carbon starvation protein CstA